MEREIKFRGKSIETGEWIYGDLASNLWIVTKTKTSVCEIIIMPKDGDCQEDLIFEPVIDKTVGQLTGLKDKNGKEIYENDIVQEHKNIGKIIFDEGKMRIDWGTNIGFYSDSLWHHRQGLKVIGNIHENPELLK
jgi:uncharacterized phage protein (TIGR01671 family)